jgi:hypothetical protein
MDGQPSLWEEAEQALGEAPRGEILDLLHATAHLWEAVHLFHAPGSALALKMMEFVGAHSHFPGQAAKSER